MVHCDLVPQAVKVFSKRALAKLNMGPPVPPFDPAQAEAPEDPDAPPMPPMGLGQLLTGLDMVKTEIEIHQNLSHPHLVQPREVLYQQGQDKFYIGM